MPILLASGLRIGARMTMSGIVSMTHPAAIRMPIINDHQQVTKDVCRHPSAWSGEIQQHVNPDMRMRPQRGVSGTMITY